MKFKFITELITELYTCAHNLITKRQVDGSVRLALSFEVTSSVMAQYGSVTAQL